MQRTPPAVIGYVLFSAAQPSVPTNFFGHQSRACEVNQIERESTQTPESSIHVRHFRALVLPREGRVFSCMT